MNGSADTKLVSNADELAYKKACNDSIYTKEVMQSYLDYKHKRVEDIDGMSLLKPIFVRVVSKGKKFKDEDKRVWKQEYYTFEFYRIIERLRQEEQAESARKDSIRKYNMRTDWSKSSLFYSLKTYCSHDFSISDNSLIDLMEKYNVDIEKVADRYPNIVGWHFVGWDGLLSPPNPHAVDEEEDKPANEEEAKRWAMEDFQKLHVALKGRMKNATVESLYGQILKEMKYPFTYDRNDEENFSQISSLFQQDINSENVKELIRLFDRWNEITSASLWEKEVLAWDESFKKDCSALQEAIAYREHHPLANGVLTDKGQSLPYVLDGNKLVVNGTCILLYNDEQYPNATGDWYKKYTVNLKLTVKVVHGNAVSLSISGVQKWWNENQKAFKNAKGGLVQKAAAMMDARPIVVKTHNVTKIDDLGFGPEMGIMLRNLQYVLGYAATENAGRASLGDLCKEYLERPSDAILKQIKMPFAEVNVSAIK